eukprot:m.14391 g.14391  ORF g.14391 m.14391 type:complete len:152 (+) comp4300_c0_seq1:110-565(+)
MLEHVVRFLKTVGMTVCIGSFVTTHIVNLSVCQGPSMMPTLNPKGDIVLSEAISPRQGNLKRGDVVIAKSVLDPTKMVCKRIIGMEGDSVQINPFQYPRKFKVVSRGCVWLQGDNLDNSTDSRTYGFVPLALISHRVIARVWPLDQISKLD